MEKMLCQRKPLLVGGKLDVRELRGSNLAEERKTDNRKGMIAALAPGLGGGLAGWGRSWG